VSRPWDKYSDTDAMRLTLSARTAKYVRVNAQHFGITPEQLVTACIAAAAYDYRTMAAAVHAIELAAEYRDGEDKA